MNTSNNKELNDDLLSDQELQAILDEAGETARRESFDKGLPVSVLKDGIMYLEYSDGTLKPV